MLENGNVNNVDMKNLFNIYTAVKDVEIPEYSNDLDDLFPSYSIVKDYPEIYEDSVIEEIPEEAPKIDTAEILKIQPKTVKKSTKKTYNNYKGLLQFNKFYDEVEKEMPEAKEYRQLLTDLANEESSFRSSILNTSGAPAYGYFQFMLDGVKYNNITHYAGVDIDTFRNDPKLLIKAAIKLAKEFKNTFSAKDREAARKQGITEKGLLSGAWLAGVGGVREYLYGLSDKSDGHTSVSQRIKKLNT